MSKPTDYRGAMRDTMNQLDEFWRTKPEAFGKKQQASDAEIEASGERRANDVKSRANAEGKRYGFLQSLKGKVFGKKAPEPEFKRPERSEDERRQAVIDRAKRS